MDTRTETIGSVAHQLEGIERELNMLTQSVKEESGLTILSSLKGQVGECIEKLRTEINKNQ